MNHRNWHACDMKMRQCKHCVCVNWMVECTASMKFWKCALLCQQNRTPKTRCFCAVVTTDNCTIGLVYLNRNSMLSNTQFRANPIFQKFNANRQSSFVYHLAVKLGKALIFSCHSLLALFFSLSNILDLPLCVCVCLSENSCIIHPNAIHWHIILDAFAYNSTMPTK